METAIVLKVPFTDLTGTELKSVKLRGDGRVKVGDMMAVAAQMESSKVPESLENVYLVARMCGLDVKEIEGMDGEDFKAIVKRLLEGKAKTS